MPAAAELQFFRAGNWADFLPHTACRFYARPFAQLATDEGDRKISLMRVRAHLPGDV